MKKLILKNEKYITEYFNEETKTYSFIVKIPFYDHERKRKQLCKTFNSKDYYNPKQALEEAKNFRNTFLIEKNEKHIINTREITFEEVFFEVEKNFPNSPETKRKEKITYNKYLKKNFSELNIKKIKLHEVKSFLNQLSFNSTDAVLTQNTKLLRKIFSYAIEKEYIDSDFSYQIKKPKARKLTKSRDVEFNKEDLLKLINYLFSTQNERDYQIANIIIFAELTGFRPAEIFGLKKKNIDLKKGKIKLQQSIGVDENRKSLEVNLKTQKSKREFPILKKQIPFFKELIKNKSDDEYIFLDNNKNPLNSNVVSNRINRVCKILNITFNLYMLRFNFSTILNSKNADLRTIQELMGHSKVDTTIYYARSSDNKKIETLEKMDEILLKNIEISD